jgi:hypothetical protein
MTSYKETHTKSKCDVYSLREVNRAITQLPDGTIKTLETETIKERAFIQKEEIQREFVVAKQLFLERKMDQLHQTLKGWQHPNSAARKRMHERVQCMAHDLPVFANDSFEDSLLLEHCALKYSCWELPMEVCLFEDPGDQKKLKERIQAHRQRYLAEALDANGYGSRFFAMALHHLRKRCSLQIRLKRMEQALQDVAPGSKGAPVFPFSEQDMQIVDEFAASESDFYEDYLYCALDSNGADPALVGVALGQLLTVQILSQKPGLTWPDLVGIAAVGEKTLDSIPYTPCLFWGKRVAEKDLFVDCQFRIEERVYDVWMEFSVMCFSTAYGEATARLGYNLTLNEETKQLEKIRDVDELLCLAPDCSEFSKLKRMQDDISKTLEQPEIMALVASKKKELSSTLRKLQMKSRRV